MAGKEEWSESKKLSLGMYLREARSAGTVQGEVFVVTNTSTPNGKISINTTNFTGRPVGINSPQTVARNRRVTNVRSAVRQIPERLFRLEQRGRVAEKGRGL